MRLQDRNRPWNESVDMIMSVGKEMVHVTEAAEIFSRKKNYTIQLRKKILETNLWGNSVIEIFNHVIGLSIDWDESWEGVILL